MLKFKGHTGLDMDEYTKQAVHVFRECARVPILTSAIVLEAGEDRYEVLTKWSQRELERGKKVAFTRSFFIEKKEYGVKMLASSMFHSDATNQ